MKTNFSEHVARESAVHDDITKRDKEHKKELEQKIKQQEQHINDLQESQLFHGRERNILAKHPDILQLQAYGGYLKSVVRGMSGQHIKGTRIVLDCTGEEDIGHKVERELFGQPRISARQNILTLRNHEQSSKETIFDDLVAYYGSDFFHKKTIRSKDGRKKSESGQCLLEMFAKSALVASLKDKGVKDPQIKIVSVVGTPLDFHFGIDGLVEISDAQHGEPERVFIDLKTGTQSSCDKDNSFADMQLFVHISNGEADITSQENVALLMKSIMQVATIYLQKRDDVKREALSV